MFMQWEYYSIMVLIAMQENNNFSLSISTNNTNFWKFCLIQVNKMYFKACYVDIKSPKKDIKSEMSIGTFLIDLLLILV